jgi:hypothetical protein
MTTTRTRRVLLLGVCLAAAVVAAVLMNLALLDRASAGNDPVGRLSPSSRLPPAAPHWTVRPVHGPVEDRGADD